MTFKGFRVVFLVFLGLSIHHSDLGNITIPVPSKGITLQLEFAAAYLYIEGIFIMLVLVDTWHLSKRKHLLRFLKLQLLLQIYISERLTDYIQPFCTMRVTTRAAIFIHG